MSDAGCENEVGRGGRRPRVVRETCMPTPDSIGIMYTFWHSKYMILTPFGELVREGSKTEKQK